MKMVEKFHPRVGKHNIPTITWHEVELSVMKVEYSTPLRHIPPYDLQAVDSHNVYRSSGCKINIHCKTRINRDREFDSRPVHCQVA